jgi:hypothetical protein
MASPKPPNSPTIPNTPPSGWVDRSNSYGGWPELYARLDAFSRAAPYFGRPGNMES